VGLAPKRGRLLTLAYYAFPIWYEFGERRWNDILTGENRRTRRKTCPIVTFSTTNPTWIDPGANPGTRGERPATNDPSHGTAFYTITGKQVPHFQQLKGFHITHVAIKIISFRQMLFSQESLMFWFIYWWFISAYGMRISFLLLVRSAQSPPPFCRLMHEPHASYKNMSVTCAVLERNHTFSSLLTVI
jgi:hypothetical protein